MKFHWLSARPMSEFCLCYRWRLEVYPIMLLFPLIPVFKTSLYLFSVFAYEKNLTFLAMKKTGIELLNLKVPGAIPI